MLTTAAPAPGGTEANALVDRFVAAGVVLAVVGTGQAAGTWQSVAAGTGGTAITAVPADPATAYDRLTSTLQARYVVRFAPPAGNDRVQLAVTSAGQRQTAELALPQAASNAAPSSTAPAAEASSPSALLWILVGVVVLVALVAAGALLLRRRRADRAEPDLVPAVVRTSRLPDGPRDPRRRLCPARRRSVAAWSGTCPAAAERASRRCRTLGRRGGGGGSVAAVPDDAVAEPDDDVAAAADDEAPRSRNLPSPRSRNLPSPRCRTMPSPAVEPDAPVAAVPDDPSRGAGRRRPPWSRTTCRPSGAGRPDVPAVAGPPSPRWPDDAARRGGRRTDVPAVADEVPAVRGGGRLCRLPREPELPSPLAGRPVAAAVPEPAAAAAPASRMPCRIPCRGPDAPVAAVPDDATMPGVRVFDVSDPGRPTEITPNADNGDFENPWPPPSRPEVAPAAEPTRGAAGVRRPAPRARGRGRRGRGSRPEPGVVDSGGSRARSR